MGFQVLALRILELGAVIYTCVVVNHRRLCSSSQILHRLTSCCTLLLVLYLDGHGDLVNG